MSTSPQTPSLPPQYPQAIQLKLYQAFIFSIPILFSIILFLLFYLFYLKRRASTISSLLPTTINHATTITAVPCDSDLKSELKNKLCKILFDETMKARDSLCCVCLGEFEMKEELVQVTSCKHVFHTDCIHQWLCNNSTCPLCRALVVSHKNYSKSSPTPNLVVPENSETRHQLAVPLPHRLQQLQHAIIRSPEGSSSSSTGTGSGSTYC